MAVALEDSVLICQPYSLTSHLGLTLHIPSPTQLPLGLVLTSPNPFLCLLASQNQINHRSSPASKHLCQTQGLGCPSERGLLESKVSQ